jgi:5'-nucleotidase/UDP-sugar diphosphatase
MKHMKHLKFFLIGFIIIVCSLPTLFAKTPSTTELIVLHTNDTHGHPLKFDEYPAEDIGGLPARATLIRQIRAEYPHVLLLDAGDLNTGRPESSFFKAEPDIVAYNAIGYDAITIGNHEFDNPRPILKKQMLTARFPFLSANIKTEDGHYLGKPYIIKTYKDFTVAVFGLTSKETAVVGSPEYVKGLTFADEVETAEKLVPILRKKADIIIALVHMGIYHDDTQGSRRLAQRVPGIDLIVDGHTHTQMTAPLYVGQTPIVQAGQWGKYVGKAVLKIQDKKVIGINWEAVPVNLKRVEKQPDGTKTAHFIGTPYPEDEHLLQLLKPYADQVDKVLSERIGQSTSPFPNEHARHQETALGDLVCDSMLWHTQRLGVDFAINNGGGIRTALPEGVITKRHIYEVMPFDNTVVTLALKGSDLIKLFDYIATIPQGSGSFPQVSAGVQFTINYTAGRCEHIRVHGKPIDLEKVYRIATNSYLAGGGDGYSVLLNALERYDTSAFQRDVLIDYLIHLDKSLAPVVHGRITIIGEKLAFLPQRHYPQAA